MPPIKKIEKQSIIMAAFDILRTEGFMQVSVRNVAKRLKCSTKPIYFQFENMGELKGELKALAEQKYIELTNLSKGKYDNEYISHGMAFIAFARDEKHLFRYLYLSGRAERTKKVIDDANYDEIIMAITARYHITQEQAKKLHFDMAIYSYGLAVMVNTGFLEMDDNEVSERLMAQGKSLKGDYIDKESK